MLGKLAIGGDEDRQRIGIVLSLREEVGGNRGGRGGCIGEHDELRRSRQHVDRHSSRDQLLGGGDVAVAGPDDHVAR